MPVTATLKHCSASEVQVTNDRVLTQEEMRAIALRAAEMLRVKYHVGWLQYNESLNSLVCTLHKAAAQLKVSPAHYAHGSFPWWSEGRVALGLPEHGITLEAGITDLSEKTLGTLTKDVAALFHEYHIRGFEHQ